MRWVDVRSDPGGVTPRSRTDIVFWASLLCAVLLLEAALGAWVVRLGVLIYAEDAAHHGEPFDGLGTFFGGLTIGGGVLWAGVPLALVVVMWSGLRAYREAGVASRLRTVGFVSTLLGIVGSVPLVAYWLAGGTDVVPLSVPILTTFAMSISGYALASAAKRS